MTGQGSAYALSGRLGAAAVTFTAGDAPALSNGDHRAMGLVLRRKEAVKSQELFLFLSGQGAVWASAPGTGAKNRFGAGTEPMMWGEFRLYQSPRRLYLKGVEVKEDFLAIRGSPRALRAAVRWCGELASRLLPGAQADSLLSLLWGSMKNLSAGIDPVLLDMRFAWRWANLWGIAPPLDVCSSCGTSLQSAGGNFFQMTSDGFMCRGCAEEARMSGSSDLMGLLGAAERDALLMAATLPKEGFVRWASDAPRPGSNFAACSSWLYSFINSK
ncbi:MAG: DNA repair protein RecO C-terminal domain-containing protein [Synergistaceae bacterium]|jgi:DNA repair protein RecO (recombination protein O)|nr:DNA repair protein RecO C-terminal domain-containing protein [Synergistaceae bacterium]